MAEAIEIGKGDVWDKTAAVVNADGSMGVSANDGHMRIGTNREILSWPGCDPYIVKTEKDEADAQYRLKKERESLRERLKHDEAVKRGWAAKKEQRRNNDYQLRQRERAEQEERQKMWEKQARKQEMAKMQQASTWTKSADLSAFRVVLSPGAAMRSPARSARGFGSPESPL